MLIWLRVFLIIIPGNFVDLFNNTANATHCTAAIVVLNHQCLLNDFPITDKLLVLNTGILQQLRWYVQTLIFTNIKRQICFALQLTWTLQNDTLQKQWLGTKRNVSYIPQNCFDRYAETASLRTALGDFFVFYFSRQALLHQVEYNLAGEFVLFPCKAGIYHCHTNSGKNANIWKFQE